MISSDITNLQDRMISDMTHALQENKNVLTFKAPTGSGKTYMMAAMIERVLQSEPDSIFLVSALSKSGLARQNTTKFEQYIEEYNFIDMDVYSIVPKTAKKNDDEATSSSNIDPGHNVYILPTGLCSKNSVYVKTGELDRFMQGLKQYPGTVYCIKDESHISTKALDSHGKDSWDKTIYFSATPKMNKGEEPDAEITKQEAEECHLVKKIEGEVKTSEALDGNREDLADSLCEALDRFVAVKQQYNELNTGINPAILIQVSNKDKGDNEIDLIENILNSEYRNLKYLIDTGGYHSTNDTVGSNLILSDVTGNDSDIDVLVVKMKATEGFDIPRACMLYQVRKTQSDVLDEQIVGRILRNPKLDGFESLSQEAQELIMKAWVWGSYDQYKEEGERVKLRGQESSQNEIVQEIQIKTTKFKDNIMMASDEGFDLSDLFVEKRNEWRREPHYTGVFSLYKDYQKTIHRMPAGFMEAIDAQIHSYEDWMVMAENIRFFKSKYEELVKDYKNSMCVNDKPATLPIRSFFKKTKFTKDVYKWVWEKADDANDCCYSLDSQAEESWLTFMITKLGDLENGVAKTVNINGETIPLIARNFLGNSDIGFVYWLDGTEHISYPDFILIDKKGRIHLFETKSQNMSNGQPVDSDAYKDKIEALKEAYACAAKLTGNYFYIPEMHGDKWIIYRFCVDDNGTFIDNALESKDDLMNWLKEIC